MTQTSETPTGDLEDWYEANWCEINGGGIVTPDQIEEMRRRCAERAASERHGVRDSERTA